MLYIKISFKKLKNDNVNIRCNIARTYIELSKDNEAIVINKLKQVFGIQSIVIAYRINTNIDENIK